ncbi:MAG: starch-binding outer membrane protein SusD/RagB family, partial [Bacteroidota bacterium]|nr:starch-binding outer membrane protein SusD/RagB family [Bacteroidota bacterium]
NSYSMEEDGPTNYMWTLSYRVVRLANDIIEFTPQVNFGIDNIMQQNYFLGMAKAYKALFFGELAAFYGSIPINIEGLAPPIFVTQTEAYTEAQKLLDEALVHFAASIPTDRDLNYYSDGDADVAKANWTATIHSLKARFFLHLKKYSEALAESKMGITDPTVGLFAQYSDAASEHSPWGHWTYTEVGEPIRGEASFVRLLKAEAGDTRLAEYFTPNDGTNFWGFAQQEAEIDSNELMTDKIVSLNKYGHYADIFPFITYQENMFIKAECEFETGDQASAANDLNLMRTAVGLPDYSGSELRNEIMKQKYLQLFLEGQSYHDMRRLGTLPSTEIPKRWIYPINEKNANPNVPADNVGLVKDILP